MLIDPRLSSLGDFHRAVWCDAATRRELLGELSGELQSNREAAAGRLLRQIDDAVVAGLKALGLPRGPVRTVQFRALIDRGWKSEDCDLLLSREWLFEALLEHHPDSVFRTWVHESIHARAPFRSDWRLEYQYTPGYEEGVAEGLAQIATKQCAQMTPRAGVGEPFYVAYECLASALGQETESLLRHLWQFQCGEVRGSTLGLIFDTMSETNITEDQTRRIIDVADDLFSRARLLEAPNRLAMFQLWKRALE
jgi:hypothetical protein